MKRNKESELKDQWDQAGELEAAQLEQGAPTLPTGISVACGVCLFLRTLKGQSVQTHKTYQVGCRIFMYFLYESGQGDPSVLSVTGLQPLVLEDYYLWLVDRYSRGKKMTVAGYMAGPRNLFAYLARRRLTPNGCQYQEMVAGLVKLVGRGSYKTPRVDFTETRKLADYMYHLKMPAPDELNYLNVLRDRAIILTLYTTGMRREEVSRLNRADMRDGHLEEVLITGKGDKERIAFFDVITLQVISEYLKARNDNYRPLFIQHRISLGQSKAGDEKYRLGAFSVWSVVKKWAGEIGVQITTHDFRHALATTMLNNGAQLGEVQDVLGHSSPVTTKMIYAHYERKTLRAAVNKYRVGIDLLAEINREVA